MSSTITEVPWKCFILVPDKITEETNSPRAGTVVNILRSEGWALAVDTDVLVVLLLVLHTLGAGQGPWNWRPQEGAIKDDNEDENP